MLASSNHIRHLAAGLVRILACITGANLSMVGDNAFRIMSVDLGARSLL